MADYRATDEFGYPLTSMQTLHRMHGIGPSQGEYAVERGSRTPSGEDLSQPGMGFTLAEYDEAFGELQIVNIINRYRKP